MNSTKNSKYIFKQMNCGCIVTANIQHGFNYALIQSILENGCCGFCTQEQRYETVNYLWINETEKYIWEDLLKCYGWKSDSDRESDKDQKISLQDITKHNEKMERGNFMDRHCGEKIDRNFNSKDID